MISEIHAENMKTALDYANGDWSTFADEVLSAGLDQAQIEILRSFQHNRLTVVRSGHARGKDYVAATAALCFLFLRPPCKVVCTGPTGRQVHDIMMDEISKQYNNARIPLGGNLLDMRINIGDGWFLVGFKAREKHETEWTGYHAPNVAVIITEASEIEASTMKSVRGLLTGNSRLLLVGNPTLTAGPFYEAFQNAVPADAGPPGPGQYAGYTLNCLDAPNVVSGRIEIPGQVDRIWIRECLNTPGWARRISETEADPEKADFEFEKVWYRPTDTARVKILGLFPLQATDTLVPLSWVEASHKRWSEWKNGGSRRKKGTPLRLGVDIAGMGRDLSTKIHRYENVVEEIQAAARQPLMKTTGEIWNLVRHTVRGRAFVDGLGEGAGVCSRLKELDPDGDHVVSVKFSESADGLTDFTGERTFANMRAYCYWAIRDALDPEFGGCLALPPMPELTQDLTSVIWTTRSDGKIILEKKESLKDRIGRSPDYGDGLAQTYYPDRRGGYVGDARDATPD